MNKTYIFIIIAVILIAGVWLLLSQSSNAPTTDNSMSSGADTTASINQDLGNISVQTPDFKPIDADLNSL
jgi:hypothetical protein